MAKAEQLRARHRDKRREQRAIEQAINDGFSPVRRQHAERMAAMKPDDQVFYQRRLDLSRARGAQAIAAELHARHHLGPEIAYVAPHAGIPLSGVHQAITGTAAAPKILNEHTTIHEVPDIALSRIRRTLRQGHILRGAQETLPISQHPIHDDTLTLMNRLGI